MLVVNLIIRIINRRTMKKINLNPSVLSTMFLGFCRHLFTCPKEGDMYSVDCSDYSCDIYFRDEFWQNYLMELNAAALSGKFSSSNASSDWYTLLSNIRSVEDANLPSTGTKDYYLTSKMFF